MLYHSMIFYLFKFEALVTYIISFNQEIFTGNYCILVFYCLEYRIEQERTHTLSTGARDQEKRNQQVNQYINKEMSRQEEQQIQRPESVKTQVCVKNKRRQVYPGQSQPKGVY